MIHITKYVDSDGFEWLNCDDVFKHRGYEEFTNIGQEHFHFIENIVRPYLEYFNTQTSTAFGNPDYTRLEGKFLGYCLAKKWDINEDIDHILLTSERDRKIFLIDRPCISKMELERRQENKKVWEELLG